MTKKRASEPALKTWNVPYTTTHHGFVAVEAATAEEAVAIVEAGRFDNDPGEERTDWAATGPAREIP